MTRYISECLAKWACRSRPPLCWWWWRLVQSEHNFYPLLSDRDLMVVKWDQRHSAENSGNKTTFSERNILVNTGLFIRVFKIW